MLVSVFTRRFGGPVLFCSVMFSSVR